GGRRAWRGVVSGVSTRRYTCVYRAAPGPGGDGRRTPAGTTKAADRANPADGLRCPAASRTSRERVRRGSEVHAAHATVATGGGRSLLRLVGDDGLGREEERRDGGGVLQRGARVLDRDALAVRTDGLLPSCLGDGYRTHR